MLIATPKDVYDYFGCEGITDEELASELCENLYDATEFGAWGRVSEEEIVEVRSEHWRARYTKKESGFTVEWLSGPDGARIALSNAPKSVYDYFWPDVTNLQEVLGELIPSGDSAEFVEAVDVRRVTGKRFVFRVGSIVEGTDAEVDDYVNLPCDSEDLEAAIRRVGAAVQEIWDDTHGCEACAEALGQQGPINPDCGVCGGKGVCI